MGFGDNKMKKIGLLLAICLPVTIACVDLMALSIALNNIMHDFSSTIDKTQWILGAYTIGTAAFLISTGKLADFYGRRKLLVLGVFLFAGSSLVAVFSNSINLLIACRFAQGISSGMMMTTVISIITHSFAPQMRGPMIAKWGFSLGLGLAMGPTVGGLLIHLLNWRAIFAINIPICLVSYFLIVNFISESKDENTKQKIDWLEIGLLTILLILLATILSSAANLGWLSNTIKMLTILFISLAILFIFIEFKKEQPLIDYILFKQPNFVGATVSGLLSYFCLYAWLFIFSIYLQKALGMSSLKASLLCSSFSVAMALNSNLVAKLMKRQSNKTLMQSGFLLAIVAFIWMATITVDTAVWQFALMFFLLGIAITTINAPSLTAATENVPAHKAGIASGIIFTIRWLGGSAGIIVATAVFQTVSNNYVGSLKSSLTAGLSAACITLAIAAITGFICSSTLISYGKSVELNEAG